MKPGWFKQEMVSSMFGVYCEENIENFKILEFSIRGYDEKMVNFTN